MPKRAGELTASAVNNLKAKKGEGRYAVGGVQGLHLRITASGSQSWVLRVIVGDKRRDIGLGPYPTLSLAKAREEAYELRRRIRDGIDPVSQRRAVRAALLAQQAGEKTFKDCAAEYIRSKSPEWKNPKHRQQWQNTLEAYAYPVLGKLAVRHIELAHVLQVLEPIWLSKTETASRLRGRIESILDWASVKGYRNGDNPARWKGHLESILPSKSKVQRTEHHRAISIDDAPGFFRALSKKEGMSIRALQFLMLTAARSGEVRGATWDEIDLKRQVWTIPGNRMKAGKEHRVPLSKQALKLLKSLPRMADSPYVFFAPRGGQLSDMSLLAVMRRMEVDAVPHGFRSTFRDWAAERTDYPREAAEMALAHTVADAVEAAYRRGDLFEKRHTMMADWADYLDKPTRNGNSAKAA